LNPSIITLLTDFGSQDYFVGAMKGVILSTNPLAHIIDLTHEIPPQDIHAAAFNLLAVYKSFPAATIHVSVVDPGVGSSRRPVLIECASQLFIGPDNGLFSWICQREGDWRTFHLTNEKFFRRPVSATFHGRDIFAPVAAALSNGAAPAEFGPEIDDTVQLESLAPKSRADGTLEAFILHIDRFGNCITNLTPEHLGDKPDCATLVVNDRRIESFRSFFAESSDDDGELFCLAGSAGFVEIAARNSSAAMVLGVRRGQPLLLLPKCEK